MNKEEIADRVPDRLRPCPRCGGETKKSAHFSPAPTDLPYDWSVSVFCTCGLRSQRMFISERVAAADT